MENARICNFKKAILTGQFDDVPGLLQGLFGKPSCLFEHEQQSLNYGAAKMSKIYA